MSGLLAIGCPVKPVGLDRNHARPHFPESDLAILIGLLMACSALMIVFDPGRSADSGVCSLVSAASPWRDAWRGAAGTALRPALIWAALALGFSAIAQVVALAEPLASGRPVAGRLTYLSVLAVLAALDLRTQRSLARRAGLGRPDGPAGGRLPDPLAGRTRPDSAGRGLGTRSPRFTVDHFLRAPRHRGGDELPADAIRLAAACVGVALVLEYLGLTRIDWPVERRAIVGEWVAWTIALSSGSLGGAQAVARPGPGSTVSGSGFATTGASSGPCAPRSGSIAPPSCRAGRSA